MNPPGANVRGASGQGASMASGVDGWRSPAANATAINA
jgi:hypothetical protein